NKPGFETTFDEAFTFRRDRSHDLLRLDEALKALAEIDERKSRVVELRFFGGLSVEETAAGLEKSNPTVEPDGHLLRPGFPGKCRNIEAEGQKTGLVNQPVLESAQFKPEFKNGECGTLATDRKYLPESIRTRTVQACAVSCADLRWRRFTAQ